MKQKIELLKTRDFGEIVSDTFTFIIQNFKALLICILAFVGIFILGNIVAQSLFQMQMQSTINSISAAPMQDNASRLSPFSYFNWEYIVLIFIFSLCTYAALTSTVLSFMALYRDKGSVAPTTQEVWAYVKHYFFRMMGGQFVLGLLMGVGFVLCLVPGVWLSPIFALVLPIIVFENVGFGTAFNKAFNIIKDNWWTTFGALIVCVLITWAFLFVASLTLSVFNVSSTILSHKQSMSVSPVLIILGIVLQQVCLIFVLIPLVASGICYFNLKEIKEGTGIMDRIVGFGNNKPDADLPAEEY